MTKKKLPATHPQKRQVKRKPRAPKIVTTPDTRGVCVDFYGDTWATTERPASWMPTTPDAPKLVWADRIARGLNAIDHAVRGTRITLATRIHALARWVNAIDHSVRGARIRLATRIHAIARWVHPYGY